MQASMKLSRGGAIFGQCSQKSIRPFAPFRPSWQTARASPTTKEPQTETKSEAQIATEKYGLEAGLFKTLTSKGGDGKLSNTEQAKQLLAQYGSAYLITSITFAIISFAACYLAVDSGVDIAELLAKIGITVSDTSEKVGTFTLAYAAHKALSPIRFPPTVALTPIVAKYLGKKDAGDSGK